MSLPGLAPCLLVLLRVLSIASGSEGIVSASEVLIPAVAAVLAVLVAFFGASWLLRDRHCASALLCLWLLVLFVAPPLADWIAEVGASAPLDLVLALAALTLPASLATWALLRRRGGLALLTLPLNAAAGAALLLPLASLALDAIRSGGPPLDDAGARVASSRSNPVAEGARPDIYYIVLDGYGREDVLRAYYDHDNASFVRFLEDRGFYVAERSAANYAQTYLSLASSLNFTYLHLLSEKLGAESGGRKPLMRLIARSRLVDFLRERGYRLVAFATGYTGTEMPDADVYLEPEGSVSELDRTLADAALLSLLVKKRPWYESHRARVLFTFDRLGDLAEIEGPRFVFAHVLVPHPPFVFAPDGSRRTPSRRFTLYDGDAFMVDGTEAEYLEGYRQQVAFVNAELQRAVTRILQATPDAVILIQGDHGPGSRYHISDADQTDFVERFAILSAYRLPGVVEGVLDPEISPVNAFRVVLDHLFGTELGRLEDRSLYSTWEHPYQTLDVTAEVRAWREEAR